MQRRNNFFGDSYTYVVLGFGSIRAQMRGQYTFRQIDQRRDRLRLVYQNVDTGAGYDAFFNGSRQIVFVDQAAAGTVDHAYTRFAFGKLFGGDHIKGFFCFWGMDADKVRLLQQFI